MENTKIISSWEDLSEIEANEKYFIEIDLRNKCGRIKRVSDNVQEFYLNTHTFYKGNLTDLSSYGFQVFLIGKY